MTPTTSPACPVPLAAATWDSIVAARAIVNGDDMRWIVHRQIGLNDSGVVWVRHLLASRDTSRVDWLRIDFGRGAKRGAYGRCWYPDRDRGKGYRISVQVPGPFPWTMERYTKPLYRDRRNVA